MEAQWCIILTFNVVVLYFIPPYFNVSEQKSVWTYERQKHLSAICARSRWRLRKGNPTHAFFKETGEVLRVQICRTDISHFLFCLPVCLSPWRSSSVVPSHLSGCTVCLPHSLLSLCLSRWSGEGDPEHKVSFSAKNADNTKLSHS